MQVVTREGWASTRSSWASASSWRRAPRGMRMWHSCRADSPGKLIGKFYLTLPPVCAWGPVSQAGLGTPSPSTPQRLH